MTESTNVMTAREYVVVEVVETEPPRGGASGTWFRYTLGHGSSPITGIRSGSKGSVRLYAEEFAENLNERLLLGYSAYRARKVEKKS